MRLRRTALRAYPLMDTSARPAEGAGDQKPEPEPEPEQKPDQEPPHPSPLPVCTGDMVDTCSETWWTVLDLLTCRNDLQVQVDSGDTMSTPVDIVDAVLRRPPDSY